MIDMIDNYEQAMALIEKMKANLPIEVQTTPELRQIMEEQGDYYQLEPEFWIEKVFYAGDEGGISCALRIEPDSKQAYVVSLTHLRIPKDCPLFPEIQDYQQKRRIGLAIADGKMGRVRRLAKKMRKKKGFGN
jgi:hypothetical protein